MKRAITALATTIILAGCIEEDKKVGKMDKTDDAVTDTCGAEPLRPVIGKAFDSGLLPSGVSKVRVIHPDTMVTKDFRPDRLNIYVDAAGIITDVRCG